jgi:hypothetical protein
MGARVSIQFEKDGRKSVVLCSHWGGKEFLHQAKEYAKELAIEIEPNKGLQPLDRLAPETVMVDFIRYLTKELERVKGDLYIVATTDECDNSDYGHHIIKL